jgi:hypothetical protein
MIPLYTYGLAHTRECSPPGTTGLFGGEVFVLERDDLAALVSALPMPEISRTRRNLLAHTGVLEAAHRRYTVLPFRFGTVAPDAATLTACIAANRSRFHDALRGINGRIELGVRAAWKGGHMYASLAEHDARVRALNARVKGRSELETYYDRIELGRQVETGLAALREAETHRLTAELATIAERVTVLPIHEDADIFNHAYLLSRAREADFDAAVERLAERAGARMDIRYVGPMPPFNFVTLQAGWLDAKAGRAA